ncbi:hypothetical protein CJF32_00010766 [Rutstroemia sp. NJR-2017a WRK4]|nr:hypothetical protein CJF32_00010766 [Rutstroemia sp. NJR-2017a WRK4]
MSLRTLHNDTTTSSTNQMGTLETSKSSQLCPSLNKLQNPTRGTKGRRKPEHVIQNACLSVAIY